MHMDDEGDDDGFVSIGTAFEVLETDEDVVKAKEKKDKELYVLDKQGRRRFHGAFTGGFSAGYFMSVGSKEGWSPAPFVSSRSQKAAQIQQRPEDYMDEDDLDNFGIAPRQVSTKDQFTQERDSVDVDRKRPSVIPGDPLLHTLVVPARSTIGALLMKSMGWKEGKGVGPTTMDTKKKVYGCALPGKEMDQLQFAPNDISSWDFSGKSDIHGIGYRGMNVEQFSSSGYNSGIYGMSGQAFGVGALEEDDDDIFSRDNIASYHSTLGLPSDAEQSSKYGWTGGKDGGESWSLSSFVASTTRHQQSKVYPPPIVPRGFISFHKFTSTTVDSNKGEKPVKSISERGFVTGDRSVFELMSPKDRERLKRVKDGKQFNIESYEPYIDDPEKQSRYNAYLTQSKRSSRNSLTEWEERKEQKEFDRVARVHKPLQTALTDKFTRGTQLEEESSTDTAQVNPSDVKMFGSLTHEEREWHPHRVLCKRFNIPDPYPNSSIVGLPDDQNSSSTDWRQKMKFESSTTSATTTATQSVVKSDQYHQPIEKHVPEKMETEDSSATDGTEKAGEMDIAVEAEEADPKPPVTLLKSIFAESSSDEEEVEDSKDVDGAEPHPLPTSVAIELNQEPDQHLSNNTTKPQHSSGTMLQPRPPKRIDQSHPPHIVHDKNEQTSLQVTKLKELEEQNETTTGVPPSIDEGVGKWKDLAEMIRPTLSTPQTLQKPLVYEKETFGPALPPPSTLKEESEGNDDPTSVNTSTSKHKHHSRHHHHKVKRKHHHHKHKHHHH